MRSDIYVMAATDAINNEAKEYAQEQCGKLGVQLLLVERDDLLG